MDFKEVSTLLDVLLKAAAAGSEFAWVAHMARYKLNEMRPVVAQPQAQPEELEFVGGFRR